MTPAEQRTAAKNFAHDWLRRKGYEKGENQSFWLDLLQRVFGIERPLDFIDFEPKPDKAKSGYIDAYIESTHVLIEQKSRGIDLTAAYEQAKRYNADLSYDKRARYIVTCNFDQFVIYDMNQAGTGPTATVALADFEHEYYRLSFLVQDDRTIPKEREDLSVQAGTVVSKLYRLLAAQYHDPDSTLAQQSLNKLCVRLVFCFYAEDAGLFQSETAFQDYLGKFSPELMRDGLKKLFAVLNTPKDKRDPYENPDLLAFPYVNGDLFADDDALIPQFTAEIADLLRNPQGPDTNFKWRDISPTIFGAVFESTLNPELRRQGGMHYTSVENIHKVIDPLFLDELKAEFSKIRQLDSVASRRRALERFQEKLAGLTFLDPACGSGNFLTETYLSLRRLENEVIRELYHGKTFLGIEDLDPIKVSIDQFYGIEINDFAVAVAKTALWIAESQMIEQTSEIIEHELEFFPLTTYINIKEGNALTLSWEQVVPYEKLSYIMGNPPFIGSKKRTKEQTAEQLAVFGPMWPSAGEIDYVGCWFKKAADIMAQYPSIKTAFVATDSICKGTSVRNLWAPLNAQGINIDFAWQSFPWVNEVKQSAQVICIIVGFSDINNKSSMGGGSRVNYTRRTKY